MTSTSELHLCKWPAHVEARVESGCTREVTAWVGLPGPGSIPVCQLAFKEFLAVTERKRVAP